MMDRVMSAIGWGMLLLAAWPLLLMIWVVMRNPNRELGPGSVFGYYATAVGLWMAYGYGISAMAVAAGIMP